MNGIGLYGEEFPVIKTNQDLIIENIKRILTTLPGETVGNLEFGCRLREYIFNFENVLLEDLEQVIRSAITRWEPRVIIFSLEVTPDKEMKEKIYVLIDLVLRETFERFNLTLPILF